MRGGVRRRFWVEFGLASASAILAILTVVVPDWAETFLGIKPDQGSGIFELGVTLVFVVVTSVFVLAAGVEWRRTPAVTA